MANTRAIWQQGIYNYTTYQFPATEQEQEPYQKSLSLNKIWQSSGAVSRWPSWAPVPNKPTVCVDVKQHSTNKIWRIFQKNNRRMDYQQKNDKTEKAGGLGLIIINRYSVLAVKGNYSLFHLIRVFMVELFDAVANGFFFLLQMGTLNFGGMLASKTKQTQKKKKNGLEGTQLSDTKKYGLYCIPSTSPSRRACICQQTDIPVIRGVSGAEQQHTLEIRG